LARVHVEVYGCSANQADAEIASGLLVEAGHTIVESANEADVSVILTCIVKTPTERKIVRRLGELRGRRVVVAGCMPKALMSLVEETLPGASMVGPDDVARIPEAVKQAAGGEKVVYLGGSSPDRTCLPRQRRSRLIHIAPIAAGCLGNCSYCIVKLARGKLFSFPLEGVVADAEAAIASGCREIWVTAEDTAAYDSGGVRLPQLINNLCSIDKRFMVRVGMMTPNSIFPIFDGLLGAFKGEKVYKFLHIPVQSGSDEVLTRMRRRYTIGEFKMLITQFREEIPGIGIATDVICGFPGETEEQFRESLSLVEWLRPDMLNRSRFWPRPGTEAAGIADQFPSRVTKDRSRLLDEIWWRVNSDMNRTWVGWEGEVLLDKIGHSGFKEGRTSTYKAVVLKTRRRLGDSVKVRVTEAAKGYLIGEEA
jgi:threonylcarbamoyladenosine tRNA methylthiotransferase CDKAL1